MEWIEDQFDIFGADIGELEVRRRCGGEFGVKWAKLEE